MSRLGQDEHGQRSRCPQGGPTSVQCPDRRRDDRQIGDVNRFAIAEPETLTPRASLRRYTRVDGKANAAAIITTRGLRMTRLGDSLRPAWRFPIEID
jgi:hypothetical protein